MLDHITFPYVRTDVTADSPRAAMREIEHLYYLRCSRRRLMSCTGKKLLLLVDLDRIHFCAGVCPTSSTSIGDRVSYTYVVYRFYNNDLNLIL